jgi:excisionase family DNA binding protein
MPTPDYSTWMTKQQAADALSLSTKMIEKLAAEKKLQTAKWKRPEGGPSIAVYHPADVERVARERNPDAEPFVLPAEAADRKPTNGSAAAHGLAVRPPSAEQFLQAFAAAVSGASQSSETRRVRLAEQLYLTIPEAAEFTGLGVGYVRRLVTEGKLALVKGAGPRRADVLRRLDLEKLKL